MGIGVNISVAKFHGFTAVAPLDTGIRGAKPRTESHSSTGLHLWLSSARVNKIYTFLWLILCISVVLGCQKQKTSEDAVIVPEGEFIMGSDIGAEDEIPEKRIFLKAFYIDKFEVTNDAYRQFIQETKHREPKNWMAYGYKEEEKDYPVIFVDYNDASGYCKWRGKRLPTEEEWEKAARGIDGRIYPWGNEFYASKANTSLSSIVGTIKTGMYEEGKSPYGAYDMAGNVWEWTASNYSENRKVVKGGSWGLSHRFARTFSRVGYKPDTRINNIGFRCAKDR